MQVTLYPDPARPQLLLTELVTFFGSLDVVIGVEVFSSLARGAWDRWSDIDLIVVTSHCAQFRIVFDRLCQYKPIFYHDSFTPYVDPCGGRVLGIGFEDEAIFHHLDLNLFTRADYRTEGALDRFGFRQQLFRSDTPQTPEIDSDTLLPEMKRPLDQLRVEAEREQLVIATHFTKKNAKRILRGGVDRDSLCTWSERLRAALQNVPGDRSSGLIRLAHGYLQIGAAVLKEMT